MGPWLPSDLFMLLLGTLVGLALGVALGLSLWGHR